VRVRCRSLIFRLTPMNFGGYSEAQTKMENARTQKAAFDLPSFCSVYSIGRGKAYQEINEGRLRATKVGRRTLIRASDAEAWLSSLPPLSPNTQAA
jgi:excisionase family DNA binding protein